MTTTRYSLSTLQGALDSLFVKISARESLITNESELKSLIDDADKRNLAVIKEQRPANMVKWDRVIERTLATLSDIQLHNFCYYIMLTMQHHHPQQELLRSSDAIAAVLYRACARRPVNMTYLDKLVENDVRKKMTIPAGQTVESVTEELIKFTLGEKDPVPEHKRQQTIDDRAMKKFQLSQTLGTTIANLKNQQYHLEGELKGSFFFSSTRSLKTIKYNFISELIEKLIKKQHDRELSDKPEDVIKTVITEIMQDQKYQNTSFETILQGRFSHRTKDCLLAALGSEELTNLRTSLSRGK
jgi:hypothetical protein